jgi:two-component system, OmpR family, response regulator BaeR
MRSVMGDKTVLIVEDDKNISDLLSDYLKMAGFDVSVLYQGDVVITHVKNNSPDLIILDILLPGKDGITICREIRSFSKVPILICTAKTHEIDRILGLEIGADDYICKPFSPREVVARVKTILRRLCYNQDESMMVVEPVVINSDTHNVMIFGKPLHLIPDEFELLKILATHSGKVFTRNNLISILKRYNLEGNIRTVDNHIKNLREKMDYISPDCDIIRIVHGIGYSLAIPSKVVEQKDI